MTTPEDKPEWLRNYHASVPRMWQPGGPSPNPAGRPKGIPDKRSRIAQEFEKEGSSVARVVIDAAKDGDMQAAGLVLSRIAPTLKPRSDRVTFTLDPKAPLTEQAASVLAAVAAGDVDPETGKLLIDALGSFGALKQVDQLEARINQLEAQLNGGKE